jgi:tetraacyldisaccharide 4'-kinase
MLCPMQHAAGSTVPSENSTTPARPPVPGVLGRIASAAYAAVISHRNARFDRRKGVVEFDRPVVSIGNLSVGGTGKTPITLALVKAMYDAGRSPAIAMRGYAPKGGISDEAELYRRELRKLNVPVVARADRVSALIELFASDKGDKIDTIVLDDGFQHRKIVRQFDVVLIDATADPFADRLLPAGWLREPPASLKRAHAAIITHAERVDRDHLDALRQRIHAINPQLNITSARHIWSGFKIDTEEGSQDAAVSWLRNRRVFAACALGKPDHFLAAARLAVGTDTDLAGTMLLRDHDPYADATVAELRRRVQQSNSDVLLTSEKDWVKLESKWNADNNAAGAANPPVPVARPVLQITFDEAPHWLASRALDACLKYESENPRE